jgi:two-component system NtrC family sensor kinase
MLPKKLPIRVSRNRKEAFGEKRQEEGLGYIVAPHIMKNKSMDRLRTTESLAEGNGPNSEPQAALKPWHSIVLSSSPPDYSADNEALERSFKELVDCYRHSGVGRRCLGVVHQMNTPLQVISFQLDLLEQKALEEQDLISQSPLSGVERLVTLSLYRQEKFRQLRNELEKLQNFTRALTLQGMHEDTGEKIPLNLNQLCRQELELYLANPIFKHQITKEFHFGDGLPLIYGHYIDFSQSFRNLVDNALEAMEGVEHRHLTVVTVCQDRRFTLRIGDTGVGIPSEHLLWIFEPFFTTKQTPEGPRAGLGLFMLRRLLASYDVEVRVDSVPGETWVTLSIPVV